VVRPVAQSAARLKEAQKLGFKRAVVPDTARADIGDTELAVTAISSLTTLVADISAQSVDRGDRGDRRVAKLRQQDG
ncbi:MAG: DNA repair protein RadA, partial [Xanthobacteraceae bacterium]